VHVAIRIDVPRLSVMFVASLLGGCAPILGNEFEVVDDASTSTTSGGAGDDSTMTGTAGDGVDHPDAFVPPPERDGTAPAEAAVKSDAPSQPPVDAEPAADGGPTGKHLVINEVDYDQPGADNTEFIEIYNGTGAQVSLATLELVLVNGANNQEYMTIPLLTAGSLADGQYLVVCSRMVSVDPAALKIMGLPMNGIQNGAPDGVALVDIAQHSIVDALSYAGSITAAMLTNVNGPVNLVEGTALSIVDSATADGSLSRKPNGSDTDNASVDWALSATPTPGAANTFP